MSKTPRNALDVKPIWHRQVRETKLQFDRFGRYLLQEGRRSTAKIAAEDGTNAKEAVKIGTRWSWIVRAKAWDIHKQQEVDDLRITAINKMEARQADAGVAMQGLALVEMRRLIERAKKGLTVLTTGEVIKMMEAGAKLERQARGQPGEIIKTSGETKVSIDEAANRAIKTLAKVLEIDLDDLDDITVDDEEAAQAMH